MEQPMLDGMPQALAEAEQSDIPREATQMHLCRWFARYGKYQKFSKDPVFKKKCEEARMVIATKLMVGNKR